MDVAGDGSIYVQPISIESTSLISACILLPNRPWLVHRELTSKG